MISKIISPSLHGYQRAGPALQKNIGELAAIPGRQKPGSLARVLVGLQQHEQSGRVAIESLKSADTALGALLDVKA